VTQIIEEEIPAEAFLAFQRAIDRYCKSRLKKIPDFIKTHLSLKECYQLQKRHVFKDLFRNPINAFWAIPSIAVRRVLEVLEKLGWERAKDLLTLVPQAFKTDFQKEVEKVINNEFFEIQSGSSELLAELEKEKVLVGFFKTNAGQKIFSQLTSIIRTEVGAFSTRQGAFTDLLSSLGVVAIANYTFGDKSLDIFGLGKRFASLWARRKAEHDFFLGESIGKVFYKYAPTPHPSNTQVFITTTIAIFLLSIMSTALSLLSHPVQRKIGFRKGQMEKLVAAVQDKLYLRISKNVIQAQ
jgi:hypothetical protein